MSDAMDTNSGEENRYGVAALDQLDDDDGPPSSSAAKQPASAADSEAKEGAEGQAQPEVESYALAIGVIEPPPDLKIIIDRTADFVRRVGPQFEGEIMQRNKGKKQFQFLENPASPYHAYYKQRVRFGAEGPPPELVAAAAKAAGSTGSVSAHHAAEQARQRAEVQKAKAAAEAEAKAAPKPLTLVERMRQYVESMHIADKSKVQEAEQAKKHAEQAKKDAAAVAAATSAAKSGINGLAPASTSGHIHPSRSAPEGSAAAAASSASSSTSVAVPSASSFSFRLKHPEHYSAVDIDIIKLTALYLARCGQEFLHGLQRREQRNAYFDFIKPQHPLFIFFQNLVEAYTRVLIPRGGVKERLEDVVLRRSRAEYWHSLLVESVLKKQRDARLAAARAEEEADRNELASIDWRDFVVVQSIAFRDEDDPYLPAPCQTVEQMAAMLAATDLNAANTLPPVAEADMDMDTDEGQPATTTTTTKPAAAAPAASTTTTSTAASAREQEEVAQLIRSSVVLPDDDEQLEIRAAPTDAAAKPRAAVFQKCLVCGDEIAIDDLAEHMRIELLDPRWKEQKQALLDKQRESSLASDSIVSSNLARMARRVIGATDKEDQARKELQQRKQAAQDAAVIYGPHSQQAREAAARAGEVVLPPPPPKQPAAPAPAPAAPIGPTAYRPPAPHPGVPGAPTPSPSPPPAAAAAAAAAPSAAAHRPLLSSPVVPVAGAPGGAPGAVPQQQPPRPGMPPGGAPMMRFGFPAVPTLPFNTGGAYGGGAPVFPAPPTATAPGAVFPPPPPSSTAAAAGGAATPAVAAPRPALPIGADEQPAAKKQRLDAPAQAVAIPGGIVPPAAAAATAAGAGKGKLIPEAEFLATHSPTVSLRVVVPSDPSSPYAFSGQTLALVAQLGHTVAALKEQLSALLGSGAGKQVLPANKIKLQFTSEVTGADTYLNKDNATLAFYNVPAECTMQLGVKERGGKK